MATRSIESSLRNILLFAFIIFVFSCDSTEPYKDIKLPFEDRVEDLLLRMSLEEKVSQLSYNSAGIDRLCIPEYNWWNECLHGVGRAGLATVFPQAIGMAAMFDDTLMNEIALVVSDEARAKYHDFIDQDKRGIYHGLTYWTPNINIFRDPRWGRGMETYGEDPYLSGKLGVAYIKGLQGDDPKYYKLIATAKHFTVHSGPESLRHKFDVDPGEYDFLETYSPHFKMAVEEAGVYSVMCAYNSYKGVPCCGSNELSALLRDSWDFDGYIVSDCWAINDFYAQEAHEIVNTKAEAAAIALKSGTDLNCGNSYPALVEAVELDYITEEEIDVSLRRLLLARMKLGMFDPDDIVPFSEISINVLDSDIHKQKALEAAQKSIVLLKNEDNTLPFSKDVKKVAVIGPNANDVDVLLGNYNGYPSDPITPFEGIKNELPGAQVSFAPGCHLAQDLPILTPVPANVLFTDKSMNDGGVIGRYFDNSAFKDIPVVKRVDSSINFHWWNEAPVEFVNADTFSVRWTGVIVPEISGRYAIGVESYPKFDFWLEGEKLFSFNSEHHPVKQYEYVELIKGQAYEIEVEYTQDRTEYATMQLLWEVPDMQMENKAVQLAKESDLVVLCMGLSPRLEGEEMKVKVDGFAGGDREHIRLPKTQSDLIKTIFALGKPTVLVLLNGSAVAINWEAQNMPAIVEAWYPGQAGGTAIADVLFGDVNPSGRLPVTFYKSVDQLPAFEDYNMEGRTYRYFREEPLFEFGYGLSYTTFKYSDIEFDDHIAKDGSLGVSVRVENTGAMKGDEVVQVYVSHPDSKSRKAIRTLKGFDRIHLMPGESKQVHFKLDKEDISLLDEAFVYQLEQGAVRISIGGKQPDSESIQNASVVEKDFILQ